MNPTVPKLARAQAVLSLIGNTPMVPLRFDDAGATILAKCEFLNASGSVKDRLAKGVLLDAEERGLLHADSTILECSSGTLAGCGKAIKQRWPQARIHAMEPAEQALLAGECPCCHFIEGVADGFIPPLLRDAPLDGHIAVTSAEAMAMTQRLHREFGLLVGTSSGANVVAALQLAAELGPQAS